MPKRVRLSLARESSHSRASSREYNNETWNMLQVFLEIVVDRPSPKMKANPMLEKTISMFPVS